MNGAGSSDLIFPRGFLWGAATAAHQIEGGNTNNDWWDSERLGRVRYRSGDACDSWRRWPTDVDLLRSVGANAYRFSIEWARIEPEPGRLDRTALDQYRRMVEALRSNGIEPVVTLHHFTSPRWLAQAGGWLRRDVVARFAAYAERVGRALGDLVIWWVSINEPNVAANFGFMQGTWPPHRRGDLAGYVRYQRQAVAAHRAARQALRARHPEAQVAIAYALWPMEPLRAASRLDRGVAALLDRLWQGELLALSAPAADWIGVNYYTRNVVGMFNVQRGRTLPGLERTDFGWEIYPTGLFNVLVRVGRLGLPVMITENGIADADDDQRPRYIVNHLAEAHRALRTGVDLRGYFYWTLLDNFEWAEGFTKRFGLFEVDFESPEKRRTPRPSAALYRRIAEANGLPAEVLTQLGTPPVSPH